MSHSRRRQSLLHHWLRRAAPPQRDHSGSRPLPPRSPSVDEGTPQVTSPTGRARPGPARALAAPAHGDGDRHHRRRRAAARLARDDSAAPRCAPPGSRPRTTGLDRSPPPTRTAGPGHPGRRLVRLHRQARRHRHRSRRPLPRLDPRAARAQPPRPARHAVRRPADPDPGRGRRGRPHRHHHAARRTASQAPPRRRTRAPEAPEAPRTGPRGTSRGGSPTPARPRSAGSSSAPPAATTSTRTSRSRRLAGVRLAAAADLLGRRDRRDAGAARHRRAGCRLYVGRPLNLYGAPRQRHRRRAADQGAAPPDRSAKRAIASYYQGLGVGPAARAVPVHEGATSRNVMALQHGCSGAGTRPDRTGRRVSLATPTAAAGRAAGTPPA